ncbi:MAG: nucleotide exchange factor GrpE [Bacteroidales bacterium]|jgi:molecular chaperone GrpE|nr:nucleotide exchange factor GrpE [Bacteroidales bacterium]
MKLNKIKLKKATMDKKKHNEEIEEIENKNEETPQQEETTEDKYAELNDKYLRLYSDFENYRKRTNKERLDLIQSAAESVIKDLLPVVDDYERALQDLSKQDNIPVETKEGLSLIYNKFLNTLMQRGLKPIEAVGKPFDENIHEAVTRFPATDEDRKGIVIDEITKGYYLYDKVIRYSKVVVAV